MTIDELIDGFLKQTQYRLKRIEEKLYQIVFEHYTDNLDIVDNKITIEKNADVVDSLWKRINSRIRKEINIIAQFILDSIEEVIDFTGDELYQQDDEARDVTSEIKKAVMRHATATVNSRTDLGSAYADIKNKSIGLMSKYEGISLKELRENLRKQIVLDGLISNKWNRWTNDIYSQYQRAAANEARKKLGLKYAIYEGGIIETSRAWCDKHNGKVLSEDEIMKWIDKEWAGKNEDGYNPIIDCGGYNCRHRWRWISQELAERLRPDLKDN